MNTFIDKKIEYDQRYFNIGRENAIAFISGVRK